MENFSIFQRVLGLISISIIPSTIISFIGDIFTPMDGYIIIITIGILTFFIALYLISSMLSNNSPWWLKLFNNDEKNKFWKGKSPIYTYGIQAILLFSIICIISGCNSFLKRESRGYLSPIPLVKQIQKQTGLLELQIKEQEKHNTEVKNIKKETSDNPRKELVNLGYSWEKENFLNTIRNNDEYAFELFLKSGWSNINYQDIKEIVSIKNIKFIEKLSLYKDNIKEIDCSLIINYSIPSNTDEKKLYSIIKLCNNDVAKKAVKEKYLSKKDEFKKLQIKIKNMDHDIKSCVAYIKSEYDDWHEKSTNYLNGISYHDGFRIMLNKHNYITTGKVISKEKSNLIWNIIRYEFNKKGVEFNNAIHAYCTENISSRIDRSTNNEYDFTYPYSLLYKLLNAQ